MPDLRLRSGQRLHYDLFDLPDPWVEHDTIVFHHGLGKTGAYWRPWVRRLVRDFRVITIDMLGNGASSRPRSFRWGIDAYAGHVAEVLDAVDVARAHFVARAWVAASASSSRRPRRRGSRP